MLTHLRRICTEGIFRRLCPLPEPTVSTEYSSDPFVIQPLRLGPKRNLKKRVLSPSSDAEIVDRTESWLFRVSLAIADGNRSL